MIFNKQKFRELREARGLTLEQIAAECGVSESIVSRWEQPGKANPRPAKIAKLAAVLQCEKSDLARYGDTPRTTRRTDAELLRSMAANLKSIAKAMEEIAEAWK